MSVFGNNRNATRLSAVACLLVLLLAVALLEQKQRGNGVAPVVDDANRTQSLPQNSSYLRAHQTSRGSKEAQLELADVRKCGADSSARFSTMKIDAGTRNMTLIDGTICFAGRSVEVVGMGAPRTVFAGKAKVSISNLSQARNGEESGTTTSTTTLVIDVCLSVYHTLVDVMPAAIRWRQQQQQQRLQAAVGSGTLVKPVFRVVVRSNCHVFHFGSVLYLAALLSTPAEGGPGLHPFESLSDEALGRALAGQLMVTRQPPRVTMREQDSAYGAAGANWIVSEDFASSSNASQQHFARPSNSTWCSCAAAFFGDGGPSLNSYDTAFLVSQLSQLIHLPPQLHERLWAHCGNRRRVALILRRNSRFIAFPEELLEAMATAQPSLCFRHFYFETLPVLEQYYVARSAHAIVGIHGAALTWVTLMSGPAEGVPAAPVEANPRRGQPLVCRRQLVELWFVGRFLKSMAVYAYLSGTAGVGYRQYRPATAWFYDPTPPDASTSTTAPPSERRSVGGVLPPRTRLVSGADNDRILSLMKKLGHPQRSEYFNRQIAYFPNATAEVMANTLAADLHGC